MVTIHELDRHQLEKPEQNKIYNLADAIIVGQGAMKEQIIGLGVDPKKIEIVLHGTDLPINDETQPREGVLFYGGHHPLKGKGACTLLKAMVVPERTPGDPRPPS